MPFSAISRRSAASTADYLTAHVPAFHSTTSCIKVFVGSAQKEYEIPEVLLKSKSDWFATKFRFGRSMKAATYTGNNAYLDDVKPWVFDVFVGWLYTGEVFWQWDDEIEEDARYEMATQSENASDEDGDMDLDDAVEPAKTPEGHTGTNYSAHHQPRASQVFEADKDKDDLNEEDLLDPTTWEYEDLFEMYFFADQYQTRRLRNEVMIILQTKLLQESPVSWYYPTYDQCGKGFKRVMPTSTLYALLLDLLTYSIPPPAIKDSWQFGQLKELNLIFDVATRTAQLARCLDCSDCQTGKPCDDAGHIDIKSARPTYEKDCCVYHEHKEDGRSEDQDKEEKRLCRVRCRQIKVERKV